MNFPRVRAVVMGGNGNNWWIDMVLEEYPVQLPASGGQPEPGDRALVQ